MAASLRGGKQRRRRGGQVGKPLRAEPRRPRGGWRDVSEGGKRETKARRLANAGAASSPVQGSRGRRIPSHPPPLPGTRHPRDRPTPLTSGEALRLPPTALEKAPPLAHAHSRSRAFAPPAPAGAPPTGLWPAPALSVSVRENQSCRVDGPVLVTWPHKPITKLPSASAWLRCPRGFGCYLVERVRGGHKGLSPLFPRMSDVQLISSYID